MRTTQEPIERHDIGKERVDPAPSAVPDAREAAQVFEQAAAEDAAHEAAEEARHSLMDDVFALIDDGKTYAEAEIAYQKSRAGFAANRAKLAAVYGAAAFGVLHLALIAITVGTVIALAPLVGPWIATAIVGGVLIVIGLVCVRKLKGTITDIRDAFREDQS